MDLLGLVGFVGGLDMGGGGGGDGGVGGGKKGGGGAKGDLGGFDSSWWNIERARRGDKLGKSWGKKRKKNPPQKPTRTHQEI